jgi:hypothetical protein
VTPPGYYTVEGVTLPCPDHTYREGWVPAAQAGNCTSCGEGVLADKTDRLVQYFSNNSDVLLSVTSSPQDCCKLPPPCHTAHLHSVRSVPLCYWLYTNPCLSYLLCFHNLLRLVCSDLAMVVAEMVAAVLAAFSPFHRHLCRPRPLL